MIYANPGILRSHKPDSRAVSAPESAGFHLHTCTSLGLPHSALGLLASALYRALGLGVLGLRVLGLGVLGFRGLGFRGFGVLGFGRKKHCQTAACKNNPTLAKPCRPGNPASFEGRGGVQVRVEGAGRGCTRVASDWRLPLLLLPDEFGV